MARLLGLADLEGAAEDVEPLTLDSVALVLAAGAANNCVFDDKNAGRTDETTAAGATGARGAVDVNASVNVVDAAAKTVAAKTAVAENFMIVMVVLVGLFRLKGSKKGCLLWSTQKNYEGEVKSFDKRRPNDEWGWRWLWVFCFVCFALLAVWSLICCSVPWYLFSPTSSLLSLLSQKRKKDLLVFF